ncbi:MAG: carbon-nitrogen hydrolase family protein [Chloroflexota bacterium]
MREVTVALVQTSPVLQDVDRNLADMSRLIEDVCLRQKVDLLIFPELATTGYECGVRFADLAERITDRAVNTLGRRAAEFGAHVLFGFAEKQKVESVSYSAAVLLDPEGDVLADYQKVHLRAEQRLAFRPGYKFVTAATRFGVVGVLVGWDLAFPEAARSLALDGAELIAVCGCWDAPAAHEWRSLCFARAYENACFVAACNRVGEEPTRSFFGESLVVGPRGAVLARLEGDEPGVAIATIDLDQAHAYQEETQLLQARQPRSYRNVVRMY